MTSEKKGAIEFETVVKLIIAAVVLIILIGLMMYFKGTLWEKLKVLKGIMGLG